MLLSFSAKRCDVLNLLAILFVILPLLFPSTSFAEIHRVESIDRYVLVGRGGTLYPTVDALSDDINKEARESFDVCVSQFPPYSCTLYTIVRNELLTGTTGWEGYTINGKPYWYNLVRDSLVKSLDSNGHTSEVYTENIGSLGAYLHSYCPIGYSVWGTEGVWPILRSYCFRSTDNYDELKNAGSSCGGVGNPIQPGTGNKFQLEHDYVGGGVFPLTLSRSYNSVWAKQVGGQAPVSFDSQWMGSFSARISYEAEGYDADPSVSSVAVSYRPSGRVLYFSQPTVGTFVPDVDIQDKLVALTDTNRKITGWKYTVAANENIELYDSAGKLLSITNRAGLKQTFAYNSDNLLQAVTDPDGRQITFTYDAAKRISTATVPGGGILHYGYSAEGLLTSVTYPDGVQRIYHYEDTGLPKHLTGITDENGNRFATYAYDYQGRAISTEHAEGVERVALNYNGDSTTTVIDALGAERMYSFQTILGMAKTVGLTQPCASCGGSNKTTSYDANGNVSSRTDFSGSRADYTYDLARNLQTKRVEGLDAAGVATAQTRTITTEWHSTWRLPKRIAEPLKITTYVYHGDNGVSCGANGNLCSKTVQETTDANGSLGFSAIKTGTPRAWAYTYNGRGQILTENASRTDITDTTTYAYYTDTTATHRVGDLWKITNALGHVTQITTYDAAGRPLSITDANGAVTKLTYTPRGWVQTLVKAGQTTTYTYDGVGQVTKISLPDAREYAYAYDPAHRLTSITSKTGEKLSFTLDKLGNRLSETLTDASGVVATQYRQTFDALGKLQQSIASIQGVDAITAYTYDVEGNLAEETSPTGRTTGYSYDALNRLIQEQESLNGLPVVTAHSYNAQGVATQTKAPNNATTQYTVNGFGEILTEISPDRGTLTYTYDAAGNVKTLKDARAVTLGYTYDALNRLIKVTTPTAAQNITYTYDANTTLTACTYGKGRLCKVVDQSGTTAFAYDAQGNVVKRAYQTSGVTYVTDFAYDANGNLLKITLPGSRHITYTRDTERRVTSISTVLGGATVAVLSSATYRPDGQASRVGYSNGETVSYGYDASGHRTAVTRTIAAANENYVWNLEGELTGRTASAVSRTYQYDSLRRLIQETGIPANQSFVYDANGNRRGNGSNIYTYLANSNRMARRNNIDMARDASGNHTSNGLGQTYTWDGYGHLAQVTLNGVKKATYLYNYQHQRSHKQLWNGTTSLGTTIYHYDLQGHPLLETSTGGVVQAVYLHDGNSVPLAIVQAANSPYNNTAQDKIVYLHPDHLGTPRLGTDAAKRIVWKWEPTDAFGATAAQQDPDADGKQTIVNLRFPGQYYDAESGLHQNWHRTYDPSLGRYISSDPIGLAGGVNTFGYVGQSPLVAKDPTGLCPQCLVVGAAAATGAALYGLLHTSNVLDNLGDSSGVLDGWGDSSLRDSEHIQGSIWGDGIGDHPSHSDENDALAIPLSASCEELAWAISVLRSAIEWRKADIGRHGGNNSGAPGHRVRIKNLQDKLDKLLREYELRCKQQCDD